MTLSLSRSRRWKKPFTTAVWLTVGLGLVWHDCERSTGRRFGPSLHASAHTMEGEPDAEDLAAEAAGVEYGVDVSYPIHHGLIEGTWQWKRWHASMDGCAKKYSQRSCESNERSRMQLNRVQPPLQVNYTELGYAKLKCPEKAWKALREFWDRYKGREMEEAWPSGNTYTNHWSTPTYMVSMEDGRLRGGLDLKKQIWNEVRGHSLLTQSIVVVTHHTHTHESHESHRASERASDRRVPWLR